MVRASLTVDGLYVGPGSIWVHMQETEGRQTTTYSAVIPKPHHIDVFDPRGSRGNDVSWSDFILSKVNELGTFILGGYFENMAKLDCVDAGRCGWVIATLDEVVESDDALELRGTAVAFDPSRYGVSQAPRFTTRNLLIGTAGFAAWGALLLNHNIFDTVPLILFLYVATLIMLPCVAFGTMLGNVKEGFFVGLFFVLLMMPAIAQLAGEID